MIVQPSLSLSFHGSCNVFPTGGIPAPVYFGALIDSTCLKWSVKKCGGRGACRIYDSAMYRYAQTINIETQLTAYVNFEVFGRHSTKNRSYFYCLSILRFIFLGLITCLSGSSYFFIIAVIIILRRQFQKPQQDTETQSTKIARQIELQTSPKPAEDQPRTSKALKAVPEDGARGAAKLEDGADVNGTKVLVKVAEANTTETTAEIASCPNGKVDLEISELKSEVEAKQMDKDGLDHQMDDTKEVKVETPGSDT